MEDREDSTAHNVLNLAEKGSLPNCYWLDESELRKRSKFNKVRR